ncbi:ABC transporter substrate-binding protein [Microbacterium sp. No. 7]|uniref:ABC transporter substrate-binding protein n=1 Tax=Microbacterium sp. No. 7 TaxID=1714373 RepID=UPI0006ED1B7A|nr:extracellular solute-binding protein [Microbacterium sp. No. 7]ALJ21985.1 ABC transporter substrate-binding protein [Microbacterium sp. No. 7]
MSSAFHLTPASGRANGGMTRRQLFSASGVVGLTALLSACAGPGTARPASTGIATGGAIEGHVSFAHWRGEDRDVFAELIARFVEKYPDVEITQDISTSTDYNAQALRRMRDGAVGDIAPAGRGDQFESFIKVGQFVDLTDTGLVEKYEASRIEVGAKDGKQYGLPYQIVFNVPIANMDVLESVGYAEQPTDWNAYMDMLDKIKSKGITPFVFPGADAGNAGQLINSMSMNIAPSPDMFAKIQSGEYKCTDDWFIEMLYKYQELGAYAQDNAAGTAVEPAQQLFATGKGAILSTGSYHIASVRSLGAEFPIDLVPAMTNDPGAATYVGIYNATFILGINSASKVQPAALAWFEFLSDPEIASFYGDGTSQHTPVKGATYKDPDLMRLTPWLDKDLMLAPRFQFTDLDMRTAVEAAGLYALTGTQPEKAAEDAQLIVDQRIAAAG